MWWYDIEWSYNRLARSGDEYRVHELSGANSAQVGCRYSSTHGAIVYKLSDERTLQFRTLPSPSVLSRGDDTYGVVYANSKFVIGNNFFDNFYVSTDGYISMGEIPAASSPSIPGNYPIISPYGTDIDTSIAGSVRFTQLTSSHVSEMRIISDFIEDYFSVDFAGTSMMVAEWYGVAKSSGSSSITSSFQCILIADNTKLYAVFIYECGGMGWSGATIGWAVSETLYEKHALSGNTSMDVGCQYSSTYSPIAHKIDAQPVIRSLNFLTLSSYKTLPTGVNRYSEYIRVHEDFIFGLYVIYGVYVSNNGYISMGNPPSTFSPRIPEDNLMIISPYGALTDTEIGGRVRYTQFTTTDPQINTVSEFIRMETGSTFHGTSMMVAEWDRVVRYLGLPSVTSTFQCVLISNGSASYAVFIYECGGMQWSGATIGWQATSRVYREHTLSGPSSSGVGCLSSFNHSTIIYSLPVSSYCVNRGITCDNGYCVSDKDVCDEIEDCSDGKDEEGCSIAENTGLEVGLGAGLPSGCVLLCICGVLYRKHLDYKKKHKRQVSSTPRPRTSTRTGNASPILTSSTRTTLVRERQPVIVRTMNEETSFTSPIPHTVPTPFGGAQVSSPDAPPAYDAATAFPPLPQQGNKGYRNLMRRTDYPPPPSAPYPSQEQTLYPSAPPPYV